MARDESRPLRADAQRNRDKILTAAVRVFAEEGLDAHLERIAKEAGVGSGTLYRNFPTRESLIEAAYRNEVAKLCAAAPELLRELPPRQALRAWMGRFLDYATAKLGMAYALRAMIALDQHPVRAHLARDAEAGIPESPREPLALRARRPALRPDREQRDRRAQQEPRAVRSR